MRRGDLYWADLEPRSGSEQRGLTQRMGSLPESALREVEAGIRAAIDLDPPEAD